MIKKYGWVLCFLVACGSTNMTATGAPQTPREANCSFDILTSTPLLGYEEIGTIDVTPGGYGVNQFTDLSDFKAHITPNVCKLGGDAAIAAANGFGMYIKATVLKRVARPAPAAPAAPTAAQASAEAPKKHGCEFDSQCKGDRICVDGHCEAPVAAASAEPAPVAAAPSASPPATAAAPKATVPASMSAKASAAH